MTGSALTWEGFRRKEEQKEGMIKLYISLSQQLQRGGGTRGDRALLRKPWSLPVLTASYSFSLEEGKSRREE